MNTTAILPVISNIAYLIPAVTNFATYLYAEAFIHLVVAYCSTVYHACYSDIAYCIVVPSDVLQYMDFFFAYMMVANVVIFYMDIYPRRFKVVPQMLAVVMLTFTTFMWRFSYTFAVYVFALFVPFGILHFICYMLLWLKNKGKCAKMFSSWCCTNRIIMLVYNSRKAPFYLIDIPIFIIGTLVFLTGLLCQTYSSYNYDILHSLWHILTALGATILYTPYNKSNMIGDLYHWLRSRNKINPEEQV